MFLINDETSAGQEQTALEFNVLTLYRRNTVNGKISDMNFSS
jgi:hypothetical protein